MEIFHIASHRVKTLRDLSRVKFLVTFPWILDIGILWYIISFHLDMRRYINIFPVLAGICVLLKSCNCTCIISCIVEFPESVEAVAIGSFLIFPFFLTAIIHVVRMRFHSSVTEILWIFHQRIIKFFHVFLLSGFCIPVNID